MTHPDFYYNARYYNPNIGRFIQGDPALCDTQSKADLSQGELLNAFLYANNNPVVYNDPTGLLGNWGNGQDYGPADCPDEWPGAPATHWTPMLAHNWHFSDGWIHTTSNVGVKQQGSATGYTISAVPSSSELNIAQKVFNGLTNPFVYAFRPADGGAYELIGGKLIDDSASNRNRMAGDFAVSLLPLPFTKGGELAKDTTDLFRFVSPGEYSNIMKTKQFSFAPGQMEAKQFGYNLDEVLSLAKYFPDASALVRTKIPTAALNQFNRTSVDSAILKSGSLTVEGSEQLSRFNKLIQEIFHAF